ncbi:solute carrier family 35 member B1 homolog [Sitophilus oryzae]|uniref:Solute carrier family 35 member B1 homolog n=1 Tax=Sitophilus oryzae TaxID=7048 RepID=A0A6J2XIL6_SITOR|nr:solute carrier family 35 member B1 homolog [Sitophilus oryzae]
MQKQKFLIYAAGIFVSYFYYGILQEKVTRGKYVHEEVLADGTKTVISEKFTFALTLVCTQCILNYIIAQIACLIWPQGEDKTAKLYYASVSTTYLLAMVASNMALQWVSYPTQVVGKSAKPIPVMLLGVLLGRKSYPLRKYVFVFLIVFGIIIFMLKEKASKSASEEGGFDTGELLLCLSLVMDGITGAVQERIRAESKPSGIQMMRSANGWSSLSLIFVILISSEVFEFIKFANKFPSIYYNLLSIGVLSAVGQLFLYSMVSDFGPLAVSIVTTTRKFFTVLGSVIIFGNSLTVTQWSGAIIVFVALFLDAYFSKKTVKKEIKN